MTHEPRTRATSPGRGPDNTAKLQRPAGEDRVQKARKKTARGFHVRVAAGQFIGRMLGGGNVRFEPRSNLLRRTRMPMRRPYESTYANGALDCARQKQSRRTALSGETNHRRRAAHKKKKRRTSWSAAIRRTRRQSEIVRHQAKDLATERVVYLRPGVAVARADRARVGAVERRILVEHEATPACGVVSNFCTYVPTKSTLQRPASLRSVCARISQLPAASQMAKQAGASDARSGAGFRLLQLEPAVECHGDALTLAFVGLHVVHDP